METLQTVSLLAATITTGMVAGVFAIYANAIMPGLANTDDRTFVGAFQALDRAIVNPVFIGAGFLGSLLLTIVALVAHLGEDTLPWIAVALVLYAATVVITVAVNVPRNDAIKAAGEPDDIDVAAVRGRFDETTWRRWNLVRVVANTVAFGLLAWALVLHG